MNKKNKMLYKLAVWGVVVAFVAVFLCGSVQSTAFADTWWWSQNATETDWAINLLYNGVQEVNSGDDIPLIFPLIFDSTEYQDNDDIPTRYLNIIYDYFFKTYRNIERRMVFFYDSYGDLAGEGWNQGWLYVSSFTDKLGYPLDVTMTVTDFVNYLKYGADAYYNLNIWIRDEYDQDWQFSTITINADAYRGENWITNWNLINVYGADDRYDVGYNAGYNTGYDEGYDDGYYTGNIVGYNNGFTDGRNENLTGFEVARKIFDNVGSIMDIPILGFITLGGLLGLAVLMGIVVFIVGLIKR